MKTISVFGGSMPLPVSPIYEEAYRLGHLIGEKGWRTATGGYAGLMEAVSRGAVEAGGHTIGVTCEFLERAGRRRNNWVQEEIRCATARQRLFTLADLADAIIAMDGGVGTLAEIAFCWNQIQIGEISPRPVLLVGTIWRETFEAFFRTAGGHLQDREKTLLKFVVTPEDTVRSIAGAEF